MHLEGTRRALLTAARSGRSRPSPLRARGLLCASRRHQAVLDRVRPTGDGELLRRRAETLQRLRADGLCDPDRRKPLPAFPRRVGVIAARNDANIDVIQALRRRFPPQDIVFCAASVQGVHAVGSVIDALGRLQAVEGVDVIVLARGGGSTADLLAFDDERLCRAIFACAVPVITSIGHTKDRPNCDHVAAAFAPVPAKAAELAIRLSAADLLEELDRHRVALARVFERPRAMVERMGELLHSSRTRVTRKRLDLIAALDRRSAEAIRELRRRVVTQRQAVERDASRLGPACRAPARAQRRTRGGAQRGARREGLSPSRLGDGHWLRRPARRRAWLSYDPTTCSL